MAFENNYPLVVIFGRANVGKSTLFNRLIEKNHALVSDIAGTTRDSNRGQTVWQGKKINLIDTGGIIELKYIENKKIPADEIEAKVQKQARQYLKRADLILFLVDTRAGLLPQDKQITLALKKICPNWKKKVIFAANKADNPKLRGETANFNRLGLGEPLPISAANGSGTGDLLDLIVSRLKFSKEKSSSLAESDAKNEIKAAIIGKPNVGKSSLINALLGEEKIIVSPIPHTTREPQDIKIKYKGYNIKFIDTAGISKKGQKYSRQKKTKDTLQKFSIIKSLKILNKADIALLMIDISAGLTHQESKLVEEILKQKTSLIIIANKWDLVKKRDRKFYTKEIYASLPFASWAPIHFISALTGSKVNKILPLITEVAEGRKTEISANALSKLLNAIVKRHRPAKAKGTKYPHIYELAQIKINPPKFIIRIGAKDTLHFSYVRFIENRLREKFGFPGTPLSLIVKKNKLVHGQHKNTSFM